MVGDSIPGAAVVVVGSVTPPLTSLHVSESMVSCCTMLSVPGISTVSEFVTGATSGVSTPS